MIFGLHGKDMEIEGLKMFFHNIYFYSINLTQHHNKLMLLYIMSKFFDAQDFFIIF